MAPVLAFILALFGLALFFQLGWFLLVVGVLAGIYGLSLLWMRSAARHLQVNRHCPDRAFVGDEITVELVVRNTGRLPIPWVQVGIGVPVELRGAPVPDQVVTLGPYAERTLRYPVVCRRRGLYSLGTLFVETGDILGLTEHFSAVYAPGTVLVYPSIVPLRGLGLPARSPTIAVPARLPLFEDASRLVGVREYQQGDSWRRIHWPATAGSGRLAVKQWQPSTARETLICLDLDLASYPVWLPEATEQAIVAAASIANHGIAREKLPVGLAMEGRDHAGTLRRVILPPRAERDHLMTILAALATVRVTGGGQFLELLHEQSARAAWGTTLAVITGTVTDELADTLFRLKRGGQAVALYIAQPDASAAIARITKRTEGIPVCGVWAAERRRRAS
jgi:uncharacterized protein (DUF58 family)